MELKLILELIATTTAIKKELVLSNSRKREIVTARFLFLAFANRYSKSDYKQISSFANRSIKTYFYAIKMVEHWKEYDKNFNALYETINDQIMLKNE